MQRVAGQGLELGEVVNQVAVLVLGLRGHVVKLLDVALPDAQGEDLNAALPQGRRHRPGVTAVGVAVGDQEDDLAGAGSGVVQDLLSEEPEEEEKKNQTSVSAFLVFRLKLFLRPVLAKMLS